MTPCEVCKNEDGVAVACVPGVPYSAAYGSTCLARNAHPYGIIRANAACCGGLDKMVPGYAAVIVYARGRYQTIGEALQVEPLTQAELAGPTDAELG